MAVSCSWWLAAQLSIALKWAPRPKAWILRTSQLGFQQQAVQFHVYCTGLQLSGRDGNAQQRQLYL
jgi:hypothetical protein